MSRAFWFLLSALAALSVGACNQTAGTASSQPAAVTTSVAAELAVPYGEFLARPDRLISAATNDIAKSVRLNGAAMVLGKTVYDKSCAVCHGADLKGLAAQHTPDLTDAAWQFSSDDIASGGATNFPFDVEWTVRYGVRSNHPNARGAEADMVAYDPQYRNKRDTGDFGADKWLTAEETEDVVEYVLKLGGQQADTAKAARGAVLFQDNATGNCFDCHGEDGTGIVAFGSTNLTQTKLYLYGSDRASILESINKGRVGVMPAFDGRLKPEEIKAVAVYVFSRARN